MSTFVHVPAAQNAWTSFGEDDATHDQLRGLSASTDSDAVWLVRRDINNDGRVAPSQAGLYRIPIGHFDFESPGDEMCYVIAGSADVEVEDGAVVELRPGDLVHWPKGIRTKWTVSEEFVQFFTMIG